MSLIQLIKNAFNKVHKRSQRSRRRSRRRSGKRSRSFGASGSSLQSMPNKENFKLFLIIIVTTIVRSIAKGKPYEGKFQNEIRNIQVGVINGLAFKSILDILGYLLGNEIRDKIVMGYVFLTIGIDISNLFL